MKNIYRFLWYIKCISKKNLMLILFENTFGRQKDPAAVHGTIYVKYFKQNYFLLNCEIVSCFYLCNYTAG